MPVIELQTYINAPMERCFDLSCSIDLHQISTSKTKEKAIAGVTTGLVTLNDTVTWEAVHFGVRQRLTSAIPEFNRPFHFRDEQVKGAFRYFKHDHYFIQKPHAVLMKDRFEFEAPFGLLGKAVSRLLLKHYMARFLSERNAIIKAYAESDAWQKILR